MCHYRQVCNIYRECGHAVVLPDELIVCYGTTCRFSPNHPETCKPPRCRETCWQNRLYPEQYSVHLNGRCPACHGS